MNKSNTNRMTADLKKYSYIDWWNGDVILAYTPLYDAEVKELKIVDWNDFNYIDVELIKAKQAELFSFSVETRVKEHQAQFKVRFGASEMKKSYLNDEIKECENIIFGEIPNKEIVHFEIWGISHDNQYISDVQYYFKRNIKSGIFDGYGFIHSPQCKFQNFGKPDPRIYGKFIWKYYKWLCSFKSKYREIEVSVLNQTTNISSEINTNKFHNIFNSEIAYQIFLELQKSTVKQTTEVADYAFIFHKMKRGDLINVDTKHKAFISMLNSEYNTNIVAIQLPFKNPKNKVLLYNTIVERYGLKITKDAY